MERTYELNSRLSRAARTAALVVFLTAILVFAVSGAALADVWPDISDATWQNVYNVRATDTSTVAEGYSDVPSVRTCRSPGDSSPR
jgi:hypothetical protein